MKMKITIAHLVPLLWVLLVCLDVTGAQLNGDIDADELKAEIADLEALKEKQRREVVKDVRVACNSEDITLTIKSYMESFNGLIYPKGLSKNSSCMSEYIRHESDIIYVIPLHSCNTMSTDVVDGIEYFNTVVVQPHLKLVTNKGRGFHIRCRYKTQQQILNADFDVKFEWSDSIIKDRLGDGAQDSVLSALGTTPLTATAAMPSTSMRIYHGEPIDGRVAEDVKIGDPLTLVVSIDDQDIYGMQITECSVKDGLGWSEQKLINSEGCPVEDEIMGEFEYSSSKTTALVHFQAHKFPYTSSVYYQCNVRLCIKHAGGCDDTPPICDANGENTLKRRRKRQTIEFDETKGVLYDPDREDLKVKVFSGLYVNEASEFDEEDFLDDNIADEIAARAHDPSRICFPQRDFAIAIAIAGLVLILIVIIAILCLLSKRRRKKELSTTGSSIYSGPYTNTAYSHSS